MLEPYVDYIKIASYEILWKDLLIKCAKSKKTIIISTGMANLEEVINAVKILKRMVQKIITSSLCFKLSSKIR